MPDALFQGCGTALITPFRPDTSLDEAALRRLAQFQIAQGIDFLVPGGTTGESVTLSTAEHLRTVSIVLEEARRAPRRVPVLAAAGGNNTQAVTELARQVRDLGVDGILSVSPAYNKPTQAGLIAHYTQIASAVAPLPVIVYNVPGRTAGNIEPATLARLAQIPNLIGVKEASGSAVQMGDVLAAAPPGFLVLSGDDPLTLPLIALGGHGLISVASNEIPGPMAEMVRCARNNNWQRARELHFHYLPLLQANFLESNPIPVKAAMARLGFCEEIYRLPMTPIGDANRQKLYAVLDRLGLAPRTAAAV